MRARSLISIVFLLLLLVIVSSESSSQQSSGTATPSPTPAQLTTLPASVLNAELKSARGGSFRLSDYAGKVLVVNFGATWCGPWRLQIPSLIRFHKQFRSRGVTTIGLSTENPETSASLLREFIHDYAVPFRVGWATPEFALTFMQGRDAIPQTFVISRSGRIVKRFIGFDQRKTPSQFKQAVEEALNEESK